MAQIFPPHANPLSKIGIFGGLLIIAVLAAVGYLMQRSSYFTEINVIREQVVPFSHEHHVRGLGIDCRYCHTGVEDSPFAGLPPTKTCMTCHSQVWTNAAILKPVRESYRTGEPLQWVRVNRLPDYAYFDHSIHIAKGVACTTCHGPVGDMPITWRGRSLQMRWCLECHRHPEKFIRPPETVFDPDYQAPADPARLARDLMVKNQIESKMDCSLCHR